ncbi:MAG: hypothetical protein F4W92_06500 [Gammaproteobacteria bacterium]|nr:hypothetical protein [Gammaproteobacteria bacterium]
MCATEPVRTIESLESDDAVTVQPNGYFEFATAHQLNSEVVSYGDLVDIINQLTLEKLSSFRDDEETQSQKAEGTDSVSNETPVSSRAGRTWKRRILVLLDGNRVTCTADSSMSIEDHLGTSLDTIKSLEGFLSTDVEPSQHTYPRVLNFVSESPDHQEMDTNETDASKP